MAQAKYLLIKGTAGLGDRMLGAATGFLYARLAGRIPIVDWRDGRYAPEGENAFERLFVSRSAGALQRLPETDSVFPEHWRGRLDDRVSDRMGPVDAAYPANLWDPGRLDLSQMREETVVVMFAYSQLVEWVRPHMTGEHAALARTESWELIRQVLDEELAPHPEIAARVRQFRRERLAGHTIGVHARASDRWTRIEAVERRLARALRRHPDAAVFLATDNADMQRQFEGAYGAVTAPHWYGEPGEAIHTDPDRDPTRVAREGLTDMLLLAGCDRLIGDRASTFCKVAMALSDGKTTDLEPLRKRWPHPLVTAWRYLVPGPATPLALAAARRWAPYG